MDSFSVTLYGNAIVSHDSWTNPNDCLNYNTSSYAYSNGAFFGTRSITVRIPISDIPEYAVIRSVQAEVKTRVNRQGNNTFKGQITYPGASGRHTENLNIDYGNNNENANVTTLSSNACSIGNGGYIDVKMDNYRTHVSNYETRLYYTKITISGTIERPGFNIYCKGSRVEKIMKGNTNISNVYSKNSEI